MKLKNVYKRSQNERVQKWKATFKQIIISKDEMKN